jgi:hypothetical protein
MRNLLAYLRRRRARRALAHLSAALQADSDLRAVWHTNIKSVVLPAMNTRTSADEVTFRLLKRLFGVERPKL